MSLSPSTLSTILTLLDGALDLALNEGPEIVAAGKVALRLLRNGEEPSQEEQKLIDEALIAAHDRLQKQLTLQLK